jgi:aminopeptidase N
MLSMTIFAQVPPIEPGVSQTLAKWRAAHYSDVRYKLNLTLEKMSPVLKGTIEIRVKVKSQAEPPASAGGTKLSSSSTPIIIDWRRIRGSESLSTISNVSINGFSVAAYVPPANAGGSDKNAAITYEESNEHLIFRDGIVVGENVIKLDFTSPILTSGSAITRYVDKEDGAEYIYSLFVPSDASTAFPVFDQPDLKARFTVSVTALRNWVVISNERLANPYDPLRLTKLPDIYPIDEVFAETKPISTYVFAFAAGPFEAFADKGGNLSGSEGVPVRDKGSTLATPKNTRPNNRGTPIRAQPYWGNQEPSVTAGPLTPATSIYVRKSQAAKFKPHAAEVFRLNREGVKFLETYFDYKFPFPKYDIVLIPEFPFGGMEHAGATFLSEASVIFPQEPTKNDYISRANLIFHEAAHQWFGDTVTMKWFDDLWLKEGFAEFMAYKTLEAVMPEYNAWKVFYERNKQAAYLTDSTKGTTPIYQEIANLNAAKSAYGNIVYRKAPSFLRQAEFFLGEDDFRTATRAFLKKHDFANAGWEDLVHEFEEVWGANLDRWAEKWVTERGLPIVRGSVSSVEKGCFTLDFRESFDGKEIVDGWRMRIKTLMRFAKTSRTVDHQLWGISGFAGCDGAPPQMLLPNYGDYGYGIFLLDDKSRDYVLKNIGREKDDFLRTMMWGSLWDSVREAELDPKEYVELVVKNLAITAQKSTAPSAAAAATPPNQGGESDESTIQTLLGRVSTAMTYYMSEPGAVATGLLPKGDKRPIATTTPIGMPSRGPRSAPGSDLPTRLENLLIDRMQNAPTLGQRITFYRAFLNVAMSENARGVLKQLLKSEPGAVDTVLPINRDKPDLGRTGDYV